MPVRVELRAEEERRGERGEGWRRDGWMEGWREAGVQRPERTADRTARTGAGSEAT